MKNKKLNEYKFAEMKTVKNKKFYAVIELKYKDKNGETVTKQIVEEYFGDRLSAKQELHRIAKANNGILVHFGCLS